VLILEILRTEQ